MQKARLGALLHFLFLVRSNLSRASTKGGAPAADRHGRWYDDVKILLVEDSKPLRRENEGALLRAGYEVVCAEDGPAALELARSAQPDLILLDMILPRMSGPEVLRNLKSTPITAGIPVVVLSSLSDKNRQKLMEEGADEYLEKGALMPSEGVNLLPQTLADVICRISRRRGQAFSNVPIPR
jgi:CheY-like chemotaxis protein